MIVRAVALVLAASCFGCATEHANEMPEFGPEVDDSATPDEPGLYAGTFRIADQALHPQPGCATSGNRWGGIVRCPGAGHLTWRFGQGRGTTALADEIEQQVSAFAQRAHASVKKTRYPCEVASLAARCTAYVLGAPDGMRLEVVGEGDMSGLLVDCFTSPRGAALMTRVCGEVIQPR